MWSDNEERVLCVCMNEGSGSYAPGLRVRSSYDIAG